MTKKKFKYAVQRGLGRCIMELKCADDVERYKDIVLWACTHETTYDGQSEGSRSFYLYEMIREFPDVMPFLQASAKKMDQCVGTMGWKFAENCQLLALFAAEGNKFALQALRQCYGELLNTLKRKRKRTGCGLMPELDNFEELCISMATYSSEPSACIKEFLIIAADIGELIENNSLLSSWNFDWFQAACENSLGKRRIHGALKKRAKSSANVQTYITFLKEKEWRRADTKRTCYFAGTPEFIRCQLLKLLANRDCSSVLDIEQLILDSKAS